MTALLPLEMSEWTTFGPNNCDLLKDRELDSKRSTRDVVDLLNRHRFLRIAELRHGMEVRTFSYVGRVRIGDIELHIRPKIPNASLLNLVRYAYGLRNLKLISQASHQVDEFGIEDLLVCQLNMEIEELVSRGLSRTYMPQRERLSSPRGRIDITEIVRGGGTVTASLPCLFHPRVDDTPLNQCLLAGLRLAATVTSISDIRRESLRLAALLDDQVSRAPLTARTLDLVELRLNRLTGNYRPAVSIIRMLLESRGIVLENQTASIPLPGFLFNMNSFFQAMLSRFLRENLADHKVEDERQLRGMMTFDPSCYRPIWRAPAPRPDFAVLDGAKVKALLDAKYRDIWSQKLPPSMLYQLVVYAVSQRSNPQASILYPTIDPSAREIRINVADPVRGTRIGQVCLRPVRLSELEESVYDHSSNGRCRRTELAQRLAFGEQASGDRTMGY